MAQLEHIEAIEKRLWGAADTLRANSNYASNEYFLPVMGLVFLRHAYSRFLAVKDDIEAKLPKRGGKMRELTKEDFSQKSSIFLQPKAQFDHLVALPDSEDRAKAVIHAMESIEEDYENLRGVLPKADYQTLDNEVLGQLLRTLNPDELKRVSGDVFGRIYEYFLTRFADQKAHDDGEFFTPISLVSLIAHVLEPDRGTVLDPACGSGGMFVQSARIVEEHGQSPTARLTFRGLEKNATTIRLAKMNLAVHGLEGDIQKAITYYEDPHELLGKADYVMANPPFNVDEIDADKVKNDPRLPFGLPGVNKKDKVSNGNYVWISYTHGPHRVLDSVAADRRWFLRQTSVGNCLSAACAGPRPTPADDGRWPRRQARLSIWSRGIDRYLAASRLVGVAACGDQIELGEMLLDLMPSLWCCRREART